MPASTGNGRAARRIEPVKRSEKSETRISSDSGEIGAFINPLRTADLPVGNLGAQEVNLDAISR